MSELLANAIKPWIPQADRFEHLHAPATPADVAEALAALTSEGTAVVPVGGGGAMSIGNPLTTPAVGLSTMALNRVRSYEPTDMTLSVEAGVTLAEIRELIGAHGQMIPAEAPHPDRATIGGLVATALTGPRRYGGGTLRDVLIGIEVAYPDGSLGKAGGLVVKNVSGFDMMRIHHGAMGTLGVITALNFKVLGRPRNEFTAIASSASIAELEASAHQLRPLANRPAALVIRSSADGYELAARYEGRPSGLSAVANRVLAIMPDAGRIDDGESEQFWQTVIDNRRLRDSRFIHIQVTCKPNQTFATLGEVQSLLHSLGSLQSLEIEPGIGEIQAVIQPDLAATAESVGSFAEAIRGSASLRFRAISPSLAGATDAWGSEPASIDLMRRLKHEFDPRRTLNPSRFAGFI